MDNAQFLRKGIVRSIFAEDSGKMNRSSVNAGFQRSMSWRDSCPLLFTTVSLRPRPSFYDSCERVTRAIIVASEKDQNSAASERNCSHVDMPFGTSSSSTSSCIDARVRKSFYDRHPRAKIRSESEIEAAGTETSQTPKNNVTCLDDNPQAAETDFCQGNLPSPSIDAKEPTAEVIVGVVMAWCQTTSGQRWVDLVEDSDEDSYNPKLLSACDNICSLSSTASTTCSQDVDAMIRLVKDPDAVTLKNQRLGSKTPRRRRKKTSKATHQL
jgi:hypothetical protein